VSCPAISQDPAVACPFSAYKLANSQALQPNQMNYKELIVWQKADELAIQIYKMSKHFPKDELYGLTSQIRRAALSIPTNIVEGYARKGDKELARFVNIAIGSLAETEYLLDFCNRLGYLEQDEYTRIKCLRSEVGKLLWNFYKKLAC
jgi:four helix bundle protein